MADSDKVAQLCQVTNASAAEAQALLAKAGGNMEVGLFGLWLFFCRA